VPRRYERTDPAAARSSRASAGADRRIGAVRIARSTSACATACGATTGSYFPGPWERKPGRQNRTRTGPERPGPFVSRLNGRPLLRAGSYRSAYPWKEAFFALFTERFFVTRVAGDCFAVDVLAAGALGEIFFSAILLTSSESASLKLGGSSPMCHAIPCDAEHSVVVFSVTHLV